MRGRIFYSETLLWTPFRFHHHSTTHTPQVQFVFSGACSRTTPKLHERSHFIFFLSYCNQFVFFGSSICAKKQDFLNRTNIGFVPQSFRFVCIRVHSWPNVFSGTGSHSPVRLNRRNWVRFAKPTGAAPHPPSFPFVFIRGPMFSRTITPPYTMPATSFTCLILPNSDIVV